MVLFCHRSAFLLRSRVSICFVHGKIMLLPNSLPKDQSVVFVHYAESVTRIYLLHFYIIKKKKKTAMKI